MKFMANKRLGGVMVLSKLDEFFEKRFGSVIKFLKRYFSVISVTFISLLAIFFAARLFFTRPRLIAAMIEEDIKRTATWYSTAYICLKSVPIKVKIACECYAGGTVIA